MGRDDLDLSWRKPMREQHLEPRLKVEVTRNLERCAANVRDLLRSAAHLGKVVLVTLARSPWVTDSCNHFFPLVGQLIKELNVPIVYAQEGQQIDYNKAAMRSTEEIERFWSTIKGKAISTELRR